MHPAGERAIRVNLSGFHASPPGAGPAVVPLGGGVGVDVATLELSPELLSTQKE